ncbi:hypothetical protein QIS74_03835 [Colletotrichum tabaci]|uniref:RRM domain-containing protein n=1 Tax=Colletotrichum tabaci TaxID=1209068 RepID=A0AAV9TJG1_9PEZI
MVHCDDQFEEQIKEYRKARRLLFLRNLNFKADRAEIEAIVLAKLTSPDSAKFFWPPARPGQFTYPNRHTGSVMVGFNQRPDARAAEGELTGLEIRGRPVVLDRAAKSMNPEHRNNPAAAPNFPAPTSAALAIPALPPPPATAATIAAAITPGIAAVMNHAMAPSMAPVIAAAVAPTIAAAIAAAVAAATPLTTPHITAPAAVAATAPVIPPFAAPAHAAVTHAAAIPPAYDCFSSRQETTLFPPRGIKREPDETFEHQGWNQNSSENDNQSFPSAKKRRL